MPKISFLYRKNGSDIFLYLYYYYNYSIPILVILHEEQKNDKASKKSQALGTSLARDL